MKLFIVKPFIVKPIVDGRVPPHWQIFFSSWIALFIGIGCLAMTLVSAAYHTELTPVFALLSILASVLGGALMATGRFVRDSLNSQAGQTKRLAEQEERIRKLEAQVAALTPPSSSP